MGIGCDDGGRIVSLNLTSFNAFSFPRGTIPTEIGMLAHLTALAVPEHGLQGSVPTELAALAGLREIDFRNNRLSSARSWLGALRRAPSGAAAAAPPRAVERVRLGFNGLRDEWGATELEGLAGLPSLVELDVENNPELSSPSSSDANVLEYAGAWPGLQVLSVGKTRLALPMSDQISSWSNLRVLNADGVRLSGTLSPLLSTRIQALSLLPGTDAPGLGGALPTEIGLWTRLEELILDYNALSSTIPTEIGRAASIKTLSVQYNERLAGPIPTEVGLLRHLARLDLRTTSVSGTVPAELANCPDLVEMYVDTTDLVGGIPAALCDASREWVEFTASCLEGYFQCDCCTACFSS
jgi:protein brassinosteroid insensitive 1